MKLLFTGTEILLGLGYLGKFYLLAVKKREKKRQ